MTSFRTVDALVRSRRANERDEPLRWQEQAACAADPELMFAQPRGRDAAHHAEAAALAVCAACPVIAQCREYTLGIREADSTAFGVWAGMTPADRRRARERARRAAAKQVA